MKNTVIQTRDLGKRIAIKNQDNRAEIHVLQRVDLNVHAGESVAITGTSGSGKSTLLGILAGLDSPSDGEIQLFGQNLVGMDEEQRAKLRLGQVGFVFQSFHLLNNLTALENVTLPLEMQAPPPNLSQRAEKALAQVGLADRIHHRVNKLSGGEQQRVALARAFVTEPTILFADEPTGNLDKNTGQQIEDLLFQLQKERNTTLILVTHDEQLAARCQTWYRLEQGELQLEQSL